MNREPIRLLLVEDDPDDVVLIRDMLDEASAIGLSLEHADRLSAATSCLDRGDPDLVLLDLSLPDSRGFETFAALRERAPRVPIVVLTGLDDEDTAVRAVHEGAQDYLVKTRVNSDLLLRAIRYALERHQFQQERNQWIEQELRLAADIQKGFLPGAPAQTEGFELGAYARPSQQVGGDFYDFYALPDRKVGVALGDAAGKGIPGALLIAKTQGVLQAEAHNTSSLAEVMERLNLVLCRNNETDRFVTLFSATIDVHRKELVYANAGHLPALLYRHEEVLRLESSGPLLGLFLEVSYEQRVMPLLPGDLLVIYSDGVTEAVDAEDTPFGEEGVEGAVRCFHQLPAAGLARALCEASQQHESGGTQVEDDKTAVVIRMSEEL